ncbi:MAG: hypothetical protein AAGJ35_13125, partial [Myxococcota bacterium]
GGYIFRYTHYVLFIQEIFLFRYILTLLLCSAFSILWACELGKQHYEEPSKQDRELPNESWLWLVGRTEQSGLIEAIDRKQSVLMPSLVPISEDAVLRVWGDRLFVINRYTHDNIQVLDAGTRRLVKQFSVGAGSNPQDVVVVGEKLYVSCLGLASIQVYSTKTWSKLGEISLAELSERTGKSCSISEDCVGELCVEGVCTSDSLPELARMHLFQGRYLFVMAQRLLRKKNFSPGAKGALAVIDTVKDQWIGTIELAGENPVTWQFMPEREELMIAQVGKWADHSGSPLLDGVLQSVSLRSRRALDVRVREKDLGGGMGAFALVGDHLWMIRTGKNWRTELVTYDLERKRLGKTWMSSNCVGGVSCFSFTDIVAESTDAVDGGVHFLL